MATNNQTGADESTDDMIGSTPNTGAGAGTTGTGAGAGGTDLGAGATGGAPATGSLSDGSTGPGSPTSDIDTLRGIGGDPGDASITRR